MSYNWVEKIRRICPTCHKEFTIYPRDDLLRHQKFCSLKCRPVVQPKPKLNIRKQPGWHSWNWKGGRQQKLCQACGKIFYPTRDQVRRGQGIVCSRNCWGKIQAKIMQTRGHTRAKGGQREDLNGQYFRSSWEANYARYLNWLISINEIRSWQFEPDTFEFKSIQRGSRFYTPDFKVIEKDGSVAYHEIKGYMDAKSKTKLKRMRKYYPDVKIILVDAAAYRAIAYQVRDLLPNWERPGSKHAW